MNMAPTTWAGSDSRRARAYWRPRLPLPCCRCGNPVSAYPEKGWQVDHYPVSREDGGTETRPAHTRCNLAAGGRRGASITHAIRTTTHRQAEHTRGIRGI